MRTSGRLNHLHGDGGLAPAGGRGQCRSRVGRFVPVGRSEVLLLQSGEGGTAPAVHIESWLSGSPIRQPDNLRRVSLEETAPETHGFAPPPRDRFAIIVCNRADAKDLRRRLFQGARDGHFDNAKSAASLSTTHFCGPANTPRHASARPLNNGSGVT